MPSRSLIAAAIGLLVLVWGSTWAVIRIGLADLPPLTGLAVRFALGGGLLLLVVPVFKVSLRPDRRTVGLWVTNALLSFAVSYGIVYWVEQVVPSGLTAMLFATYPLMLAVLGHFFLPGERLTAAGLLGTAIGFVGVGVIFSEDLSALAGEGVQSASVIMLLSPLVSAVANVVIKRWGKGVHPISLTSVPLLAAAALVGGMAGLTEAERTVRWSPSAVGSVLYLGIFGSAIAFVVYFWLLDRLPATRLSLITYGVPVVAVALGVALFGEPLTPRVVVGGGLVLSGIFWASRAPAGAAGGR